MNMPSTAPRSCCLRALSVLLKSWNMATSLLCVSVSAVIWNCVAPARMMGMGPGLRGGMKGMRDNVLKTASVTVSQRRPRRPSPR